MACSVGMGGGDLATLTIRLLSDPVMERVTGLCLGINAVPPAEVWTSHLASAYSANNSLTTKQSIVELVLPASYVGSQGAIAFAWERAGHPLSRRTSGWVCRSPPKMKGSPMAPKCPVICLKLSVPA